MWLLLACTAPDPEAARQAWMREVLVRENEIWRTRPPDLLAGKYARLDADRYLFLRGTAGFWFADLARPAADRPATRFVSDPASAAVLLVGDPHPENLGTCLPGDEPQAGDPDATLTIEQVDLDGAVFGPWIVDVRRAALGLAALPGDGCDPACIDGAVRSLARGYAAEIAVGTWDPSDPHGGRFFDELWDEAREEGVARQRLADWTESGRLLRDGAVDDEGAGMLALTADEAAQLDRLLDGWTTTRPRGFRRLDAVRRFGAGVASFPAFRYIVLWDRGADGPEDDALLQVREVVDPPGAPGRASPVPALFEDNADRVAQAAALLWSRSDSDVLLTGLADGTVTFKITNASSWFAGLDHEDVTEALAEGDASAADFAALGLVVGRALAAAHARGVTADGDDARAAILRDLDGDATGLEAEIAAAAEVDLARLALDHELFRDVRADAGPLLGADVPARDLE